MSQEKLRETVNFLAETFNELHPPVRPGDPPLHQLREFAERLENLEASLPQEHDQPQRDELDEDRGEKRRKTGHDGT
jgi:hypothetical protein